MIRCNNAGTVRWIGHLDGAIGAGPELAVPGDGWRTLGRIGWGWIWPGTPKLN
jgi:hypothetical protein